MKLPRLTWTPNDNGVVRTIAEACSLARKWGVVLPDYVSFHIVPIDDFAENEFARTTEFREFDGTIIRWDKFFNHRTGKIPFRVRKDVFSSDEAIVAVFGHECFELEQCRVHLDDNSTIEEWEAETMPDNEGNFHWQAWEYADSLVEAMRAGQSS